LCRSLPGGDGGELVGGVEDPAGGEGVGGAGVGQALAREDGCSSSRRTTTGKVSVETRCHYGLQCEDPTKQTMVTMTRIDCNMPLSGGCGANLVTI